MLRSLPHLTNTLSKTENTMPKTNTQELLDQIVEQCFNHLTPGKNIHLIYREGNPVPWELRIDDFESWTHLKKGMSFMGMMMKVAQILDCENGDQEVYKTYGCPTCGCGDKDMYTLKFW